RRNKKHISMAEMQESIEKIMLGPERRSRMITEKEKEVVAYHEAGHALVAQMIKEADPVRKVTIIPRGMAGGVTWFVPRDDKTLEKKSHLEAQLAMALGGRAAEEIVFGEITTGASQDLKSVTDIARTMVMRYGMSDRLGPITFGEKEELIFLGREIGEQRNYSEEVATMIDEEIKLLVNNAHQRAKQIVTAYRQKLEEVARRLLEEETIDADEFEAMFVDLPPESVVVLSPEPVPA
ncbi:MAG: cell division protein FtsH, partial [Anaerolineae bacterium]